MAEIKSGDIKLMKSQVLLDTPDGGGQMTANEIIDGQSNNLFPDVDEMDRLYGRVGLRKFFPAIKTPMTPTAFGVHVIISRMPADPNVSVNLFTTKNWFDRRTNAQNQVEQYLARDVKWEGHLLELQLQGQRSFQISLNENSQNIPAQGKTVVLIANENKATEKVQFVRVTEIVANEVREFEISGRVVKRRIVTCGISDALRNDFEGQTVQQFLNGNTPIAFVRDTRVADATNYYGIKKLVQDIQLGSTKIQVDSIYSQLVPSAQTETPLSEIDAAGQLNSLVAGRGTPLTKQYSITVSSSQGFYLGSAVLPKSVSFTLFGSAITDVGGELKNSAGTVVGTIDYQNGLISWNANAGTGATTLNLSFTPAASPSFPQESALIYVTAENRGYNWLRNILPLPAPASLQASYVAQGKVYTLRDNGAGQLRGADSAYGSGTINYETGAMVMTTGALPDANTAILLTWGNKVSVFERASLSIKKAYIEFDSGTDFVPGTLTVNWLLNGVEKSAVDDGVGNFTGDATGIINYADGIAKMMPALLPNGGTTLNLSAQKGDKLAETVSVVPSNGAVNFVLENGSQALIPKSIRVRVPVRSEDGKYSGEVDLYDKPINATTGRLVTASGIQQGNVNYATRTFSIAPSSSVDSYSYELEAEVRQKNMLSSQVSYDIAPRKDVVRQTITIKKEHSLNLSNVVTAISIAVSYRDTSAAQSLTDEIVMSTLKLDLTEGFAEQILSGSVRFTLGGSTYIDRMGSIYRNPSVTTGSGTIAGQIHYGNGNIELTGWDAGAANSPALESLVTQIEPSTTNQVSFRAPMLPLRPQSLTLTATKVEGGQINVMPDADGYVDTTDCEGYFNFDQAVGQFVFRNKVQITSANRPEIEAQPWYDVGMEFTENGVTYINTPVFVLPETIRFSAVAFSYLPLNADLLGLDPVRLPSDGRVPIFRRGDIAVIHNTQRINVDSAVALATFNVGRTRLSYIKLYDSTGLPVDQNMYQSDPDLGDVTFLGTFDASAYQLPIVAEHRIEDAGMCLDVQINGELTLNIPISHAYSAGQTFVSSAMIVGDMQARAHTVFSQASWSNTWSDEREGSAINAQYNEVLYPIEVSNKSANEENWALIFTSATEFRIVGKNLGQIGTGNTSADTAPPNPIDGSPYFKIKALGFGAGWSAGNVLRFNTAAANYPIWAARTVKQGQSTVIDDSFQLQVRCGVDRV
ncbi:hypothetical protein [Acinetobacter sp. YH12219]|uniref:hypothetical protein n=1 Tax=Acinetobacter sp. YH12219 TaxID=2601153 RepID=UPI0015D186BE|nr:hypothetical protein [Acinetobacter sp. YH12219]